MLLPLLNFLKNFAFNLKSFFESTQSDLAIFLFHHRRGYLFCAFHGRTSNFTGRLGFFDVLSRGLFLLVFHNPIRHLLPLGTLRPSDPARHRREQDDGCQQ